MNTRELILEMLLEVARGNEYSHILIRNVLDKYDYLSSSEKAFIKRIFEGTLERQIQLDYILNQFSKVPVHKMKPVIRNILRMSVYQILFMDAVPDSAACNEAVKLAERKKFHSLKGFVNGILRNVARQKENITYPNKETDIVSYLSVCYSMPKWLIEKWMADYGAAVTEDMAKALLKEHPITIRIREGLSDKEKESLVTEWEKKEIQVQKDAYLDYAYHLKNVEGLGNLPGFSEGNCTVQDISSMLVAEIAGVKEGDEIIDVCAAPGGKATHVADKLRQTGHVEARDLTINKVELIEENKNRLGLTNLCVCVQDACQKVEDSIQKADVVLADLPCSGLGIMGKKRDIKYHVTKESLEDIVKLQKEILSVIYDYVKVGGTLIYSTCTINKAENEEMVEWFTKEFPFTLESIEAYLPESLWCDTTKKGYLQLLPGKHESDGFFMARLKRK